MINNLSKIFILLLIIITVDGQTINCDHCGKKIEDRYVSVEEKNYHPECYENFIVEKCSFCSKPLIGQFIEKDGKRYHEKCFLDNIALRCDLCGEVIKGSYISDYWGNRYHITHQLNESKCDYCGRYISGKLTGGGSKYNDGRVVCGICELTAISNTGKAKSVLAEVRESLEKFGVEIEYESINLKLVDKNELIKITNEIDADRSDPRGFAEYKFVTSNDQIIEREITIYILNGIPKKEFEAVAAHELMHVWQYLYAKQKLKPQFSEGSAELASYLYHNQFDDDYSRFIIYKTKTNENRTYGEGFRRIKRVVDKLGLDYTLKHIKILKDFPPGY